MPHVGQEMLTIFVTHDFTPFGEFMISHIHYIHISLQNLSVLGLCLSINDCFISDLFSQAKLGDEPST